MAKKSVIELDEASRNRVAEAYVAHRKGMREVVEKGVLDIQSVSRKPVKLDDLSFFTAYAVGISAYRTALVDLLGQEIVWNQVDTHEAVRTEQAAHEAFVLRYAQ